MNKAEAGRKGGLVKSVRKSVAVRRNGREGGRPPAVDYVRCPRGHLCKVEKGNSTFECQVCTVERGDQ